MATTDPEMPLAAALDAWAEGKQALLDAIDDAACYAPIDSARKQEANRQVVDAHLAFTRAERALLKAWRDLPVAPLEADTPAVLAYPTGWAIHPGHSTPPPARASVPTHAMAAEHPHYQSPTSPTPHMAPCRPSQTALARLNDLVDRQRPDAPTLLLHWFWDHCHAFDTHTLRTGEAGRFSDLSIFSGKDRDHPGEFMAHARIDVHHHIGAGDTLLDALRALGRAILGGQRSTPVNPAGEPV